MYVGAGPVEVGVWFLDSGSLEQLLVGRTKEQKAGREEEKQNDKDLVREQSGYRGP
jgi:Zn-finger nucleic acid-binding protein